VETIAAIATPPGEGALALLRVSGPGALSVAARLCGGAALSARTARRVLISDAHGLIDEAVAVHYPAETSPTGEDLVELTLHGSPYIARRALDAALRGARLAKPGEFTQRAFLNGKLDLAQAEAVAALIRARHEASHRAALRQLGGGLSDKVRRLKLPILDLLVRVEACLDHPEEDIPALSPEEARAALAAARAPVEALEATFAAGRLAAEGARLALVGRPNAGKSSLLNALLGRRRAIVTAQPGTTRDTLEEPFELSGRPAVLVDTAGLRDTGADEAEREGMARAEQAFESCDAAVLVVDAARPQDEEDARVHARLVELARRRGTPLIAALNKADLAGGHAAAPAGLEAETLRVSATAGTGLDELKRRLGEALGTAAPEAVVVTSARHAEALRRAAEELREAEATVDRHGAAWEDRAAFHLREALRRLGGILGEGASDEALHEIFSRFCVGK
jgi:tRNA modification GTPase